MMTSPTLERTTCPNDNEAAPLQSNDMTMTQVLTQECFKMLSLREVAEALGVAPITIERLVARGTLPFYRVARRLRFRPADISAWLERQRTDSINRS